MTYRCTKTVSGGKLTSEHNGDVAIYQHIAKVCIEQHTPLTNGERDAILLLLLSGGQG